MTIIENLTDDPIQHTTLVMLDGTKCSLTLTFDPQQDGWFADYLYIRADGTTWTCNGLKFVTSPNILRQFRNTIPFGILVTNTAGMDPLNLEDFENGTTTVYLLQGTDVADVETAVYGGQ